MLNVLHPLSFSQPFLAPVTPQITYPSQSHGERTDDSLSEDNDDSADYEDSNSKKTTSKERRSAPKKEVVRGRPKCCMGDLCTSPNTPAKHTCTECKKACHDSDAGCSSSWTSLPDSRRPIESIPITEYTSDEHVVCASCLPKCTMRPDQSPKHAAADNDNSSAADSDTSNTATLGPILTRQIDEEFLKLGGHDSILSAVDIKAITNDILDNVVARTFRGMKGIPPLVQQRCRDQVQALANGKRKNQILLESNKPHTNEVPAPNPSPSKKPAVSKNRSIVSFDPNIFFQILKFFTSHTILSFRHKP